jgi:MFS superfamily sulfate permease-like transporter
VYDAWNRLVEVRAADDSTVVAQYEYDGRNFRTVKKSCSGGQLSETRHFYYNAGWQVLEERVSMYIVLAFLSLLLAAFFFTVTVCFNWAFIVEAIASTVLAGAFFAKYCVVRRKGR